MTTKHYNFRHEVGLRLIKLLNICLMVVPFLFVYNYYYGRILSTPYYTKGDIVIAVIYLILSGPVPSAHKISAADIPAGV